MNKKQALQWCVDNLPRWPTSCQPDTQPIGWTWYYVTRYAQGFYLVDTQTGESISDTEYYSTKNHVPCGQSFSEMMQELAT